jgi:translation initiation factor IF-3
LRLADEVKDIGMIESQPLLDGRNMVMVLGPTRNAGVKQHAENEDTQGSQEAVHGDGNGRDLAAAPPPDDTAGSPGEEPAGEAEARAEGRASRA